VLSPERQNARVSEINK